MKILITGGAGFIGSHLCQLLVKNGHRVTILDNFSTGSYENIAHLRDDINLITGDIRNSELVEHLVKSTEIIVHLAAAVGVKNIIEKPIESLTTNYNGSENILCAAAKFNKRILIASTSEIYGKNPKQPLSEADDRVIGNPRILRWSYADAKALEESLAHALYLGSGLPVTTIRFFNTVGPKQSGNYGMVLPRFVNSALKDDDIQIYGSGNQTRVFCHVLDAIQAIILIIQSEQTIGEVYNLGGEGEISINKLAQLVIQRTNSKSKITHLDYSDVYPSTFEDMQRRVPDITKIKSALNWQPKKSIEQIIDDVALSIKAAQQ